MMYDYRIDEVRLSKAIPALLEVIRKQPQQKNEIVSFRSGYLDWAEGYKEKVYWKARKHLDFDKWNAESCGSGLILDQVRMAFLDGNNLIHYMTNDFFEKAEKDIAKAETILFNIYHGKEPEVAFSNFIKYFGARYDRISYLFFLKDKDKYVPMRPSFFQDLFELLNIQSQSTKSCSWEHYMEFNQIIADLKDCIQSHFKEPISLLDAHSFIWTMHLIDDELKEYEDDYRDYSDGKVKISHEQWKEILLNQDIVSSEYIELLGKIYVSPNHATTCYQLGLIDKVSPQSYISPVVSMGKKITQAYGLPEMIREDGSRRYWAVMFLGRNVMGNRFEWKMRPELAEVFEELFAETIDDAKFDFDAEMALVESDDVVIETALERSAREVIKTKSVVHEQYRRDPYISRAAKQLAGGVCMYCGEEAPFIDDNGQPYLESHHIQWLSKGGRDSLDNVAALCPNCHRRMHVLDLEEDREYLLKKVRMYCKEVKSMKAFALNNIHQ